MGKILDKIYIDDQIMIELIFDGSTPILTTQNHQNVFWHMSFIFFSHLSLLDYHDKNLRRNLVIMINDKDIEFCERVTHAKVSNLKNKIVPFSCNITTCLVRQTFVESKRDFPYLLCSHAWTSSISVGQAVELLMNQWPACTPLAFDQFNVHLKQLFPKNPQQLHKKQTLLNDQQVLIEIRNEIIS